MAMTMSTSITLVLQCERAVGKKSVHIYRRWHEICHLARMALSKHSPVSCLRLRLCVQVSLFVCVPLCTTVRVCVHVIEPTDMQVVAVVIDTWAAPIEANSCRSSDALRLRAL